MGLKKGMTNNPEGRPVGSQNKVTVELRKRINDFLNDNWDNLQDDFEQLEPKERANFYEKLLQYGLPKMQHTQLTGEFQNTITGITFDAIFPPDNELEAMDDTQLDQVIDNVKSITNG